MKIYVRVLSFDDNRRGRESCEEKRKKEMKQKERKGRKKKKSIRVNLDLEWFNYFDYSRREIDRE